MSQDTLVFIIPAASNGRIEIINAVTEERASVATAAGQPVNVYYHKADAPPPPPPPPPPQPPQPGVGNYGDGWPTPPTSANYIWLRQGGNNNINFKQSTVIEGETFDGNNSNYALKLTDCKGTVYFKGCTFKNAKQGIAVSNPSKLSHAPSVHLIGCQFVDCYKHETPGASQPMAQVGVYYHDPMPRDDDQPTIGMYGCRFINSGIGSSDARLREQFARQFHHGAYIKGNAIIEAYDNLFVNYSGQGIKAIGMAADLRRNAFLGGAVGFNFGQDAGQQDKTGRWQMACYASGNLVYGMGDLQADNQRLGWGCVLESCVAALEGNIFCSPTSVGDKTPAIRVNRVRDYGVSVYMEGAPNYVADHTHLFEVQGSGEEWGPTVRSSEPSVILDNLVSPFASRNGGTISDADMDYDYAPLNPVTLDLARIEQQARDRTTTAADVLAMARAQIA
jgi:hypothetical protein